MHVHILGVGGTFMAGVALLARAAGHRVTGSDQGLYPPMSTQLAEAGITVWEGYEPGHLDPAPDRVVIGNALSRGNPAVEYALDTGLAYTSGPQWLAENVLHDRWVLAVAGTHGKTTTASILAWLLEDAGLAPGFLIGGIPGNFGVSARFGESDFFVVEADEYDTAFFDKRSKFIHYRPRTLVLNNLEFDHADIFEDLAAIKRQFHHLVRTVPASGRILHNAGDANLDAVLAQGCWSRTEAFGERGAWRARPAGTGAATFALDRDGERVAEVHWSMSGAHNRDNAVAAIAAARHVGVTPEVAAEALGRFAGIKRRMEVRGTVAGVTVLDDFAHHPTAIEATLGGLRAETGAGRVIAVLEPRSNTMRAGHHRDTLADSLRTADQVFVKDDPDLAWDLESALAPLATSAEIIADVDVLAECAAAAARPGDCIVVMSNGGFGGIHDKLLVQLEMKGKNKEAE